MNKHGKILITFKEILQNLQQLITTVHKLHFNKAITISIPQWTGKLMNSTK